MRSRLSNSGTTGVLLSVLLLLAVMFCLGRCPMVYVRLVAEDNLGEWATAGAYALAGMFSFLALAWGPRRGRWRKALLIGLGSASVLIALEEASWGQRIFEFDLPAFFAQGNTQGEFTLHNLTALEGIERACRFAMRLLVKANE